MSKYPAVASKRALDDYDCLVIMTFGREEYAHIPMELVASPYGTPMRSRYLAKCCTDEAIAKIEHGYKGVGYYFLRVTKQGQKYLIPLRKIEVQHTTKEGEEILIEYNVTSYAWPRQNVAQILEGLKEVFEIETRPHSDKAILVFTASNMILSSLIETGDDANSWRKTIDLIKQIVPGTDVMNANRRIPLLMYSGLINDKRNSQVARYDNHAACSIQAPLIELDYVLNRCNLSVRLFCLSKCRRTSPYSLR